MSKPEQEIRNSSFLSPTENLDAYDKIFTIEVVLRELIIDVLSEKKGHKWYKELLPSDLLQKYQSGIDTERSSFVRNGVEHHPIYYLDFPDISKILEKNWNFGFKNIFKKKEDLKSYLQKLEPTRNKIAHSRIVTSDELDLIYLVYKLIMNAVGSTRFKSLVRERTEESGIGGKLRKLENSLRENRLSLVSNAQLHGWNEVPRVWEAWWFDLQFASGEGQNTKLKVAKAKLESITAIQVKLQKEIENLEDALTKLPPITAAKSKPELIFECCALLDRYSQMPRLRGNGHILEDWLSSNEVIQKIDDSIKSIVEENAYE